MSTYGNFRLPLRFKVAYSKDPQDLEAKLQPFVNAGVFPMIQEYFQGVKVNQGVLRCGGEIIGLYQYLGKREYPLTGGVTSLHLSVPVDSKLKNWTISLLEKMHWDGPAMVEYRV